MTELTGAGVHVTVVAHELGHQWFGDAVEAARSLTDSSRHPWLVAGAYRAS